MEDTGLPNTGPTDELASVGTISGQIYASYARATGPLILWGFLFFLAVLSQIFASGVDFWTSTW